MQKIVPHLWFDKEAKAAAELYVSLFPESHVDSVRTLHETPSGDVDIVNFTLAGQKFMSISAGPYFKLNPSISMFVVFDSEEKIVRVWETLIEGGKALMPFNSYPWAHKYGWLEDKYGLSWQLSMSEHHTLSQKITPLLMFTQDRAGKAREAIEFYVSVFKDAKTEIISTYEAGEGDVEGFVKHGRFYLENQLFMAMDSSGPHQFAFNEAISFVIYCASQNEIDYFWEKLSAVPEAEQCGWLKDKFGVSWQVVPTQMGDMMSQGTSEQIRRVTESFLQMKKFDLAKLEQAYRG